MYVISFPKNQEILLLLDPIGNAQMNEPEIYSVALTSDGKYAIIWTPNCQIYEFLFWEYKND